MTKTKRVILGFLAIELMLGGLWLVLALQGGGPEFQSRLGQAMGAAMGALLGLGVVFAFVARRQDRESRERAAQEKV